MIRTRWQWSLVRTRRHRRPPPSDRVCEKVEPQLIKLYGRLFDHSPQISVHLFASLPFPPSLASDSPNSSMFPILNLFQRDPCPERDTCKRPNCIFSHDPNTPQTPTPRILVESPPQVVPSGSGSGTSTPSSSRIATPRSSTQSQSQGKRGFSSPLSPSLKAGGSSAAGPSTGEPPRKLQRVGTAQKPVAIPTATTTSVSLRRLSEQYMC